MWMRRVSYGAVAIGLLVASVPLLLPGLLVRLAAVDGLPPTVIIAQEADCAGGALALMRDFRRSAGLAGRRVPTVVLGHPANSGLSGPEVHHISSTLADRWVRLVLLSRRVPSTPASVDCRERGLTCEISAIALAGGV